MQRDHDIIRTAAHPAKHAMNDAILIRDLRGDDPIPAITAMLHEAYAPLAAAGMKYWATYQDDATTLHRLTTGHALIAEQAGRIVGTVTLYEPGYREGSDWYHQPGVYAFGQFCVRPSLQRCGLGARMMRTVEDLARAKGAAELACDTAEHAHHLRQWYDRMGYRFIEFAQWDVTNFRSVILSKRLIEK
jgi:GNAT superfamily N-acetyltransferase